MNASASAELSEPEQLELPLLIEHTEKQIILAPLEVWPVNLPFMEPKEQLNILAEKVRLGKSADVWRHYFKPRGFGIMEFYNAIYERKALPDFYPEQPYRMKKVLNGIKKLFQLEKFPIGIPSTWVCSITGKPYLRDLSIDRSGKPQDKAPFVEVEKPRRAMSEARKVILRKRNAMKRVLKVWGLFAPDHIESEYKRKGWDNWGPEDDQLWLEEQEKWNRVKKPKVKRHKKGISTDNDAFLKTGKQ